MKKCSLLLLLFISGCSSSDSYLDVKFSLSVLVVIAFTFGVIAFLIRNHAVRSLASRKTAARAQSADCRPVHGSSTLGLIVDGVVVTPSRPIVDDTVVGSQHRADPTGITIGFNSVPQPPATPPATPLATPLATSAPHEEVVPVIGNIIERVIVQELPATAAEGDIVHMINSDNNAMAYVYYNGGWTPITGLENGLDDEPEDNNMTTMAYERMFDNAERMFDESERQMDRTINDAFSVSSRYVRRTDGMAPPQPTTPPATSTAPAQPPIGKIGGRKLDL